MESSSPSFSGDDLMVDSPDSGHTFEMTYRHWFVVALLVLMNVVIFGCIFLAAFGKIRVGF